VPHERGDGINFIAAADDHFLQRRSAGIVAITPQSPRFLVLGGGARKRI
jgi:hypothetical protein